MRTQTAKRALALAAAALSIASTAAAHPGHGLDGGSSHWLHYLSDPLHVAPLAAVGLALALAWRRRSARTR
jgi:hydrogenase/urease accessory protein HupE